MNPPARLRGHDGPSLRLVRASQELEQPTLVYCRARQLGHRLLRIFDSSPRQPDRLRSNERLPAKNHAGSDHPFCLRAIRRALHERATEMELSLGGAVLARRGVFHVSVVDNWLDQRHGQNGWRNQFNSRTGFEPRSRPKGMLAPFGFPIYLFPPHKAGLNGMHPFANPWS